ncbi:DUF2231 domain-containing protein [Sinorhizobium alkalisoli]|uniref:DUF2231 domain-containing protein n=1 Tax=Sinorhizobium alkalisoli TaxID=1752398 RepID=A0A1E3VFG1_9HYPH|nr:DUF2231 domain-containing protein [Sinorhizobium alkalisoli]MCG5480337.1 DUF2231 domain-containing protein [Sinorhizobium alkalisoli]ODR92177.1 hypothetical protein A8M32_06685 [Sinorhizobium alkalisoli]
MTLEDSRRAVIVVTPFHLLFAQFPVVCFTLTLLTDIAFWQTGFLMWQNFSEWLLFVGLVFGVIAAVVGAVEFLLRPARFAGRTIWLHAVGYVLILGLAFLNSLVHAGDGWTAVVPWGLTLSAATVLLIAIIAVIDGLLVRRPRTHRYARSGLS